MNTQLHDRIRFARKRLKLTQADIAQSLEITNAAVGAWEDPKKTNSPSSANLRKLAALLCVSLEWLGSDKSTLEELDAAPAPQKKGVVLSDEERELIGHFRRCSPESRAVVLATVRAGAAQGRKAQQ